ncbi:zincin-like metallopeptidase domain-containing protein [Lacrimispora sp. 38-1]|uniref:zincin-like metallopeptidase domain-containing protein n=1 Tax=Lacrimispora sp. 38-1 TaxID=3125778 RepID=UPI003CE6EFC4
MAHSTDHTDRLNRPMMNMLDTLDYAREELNAEIGTIFTKCNLGIEFDETGYIEEQHTAELIINPIIPELS